MSKNFLRIAFIFAFLGVTFGAFAAHGLKSVLSEYQIGIFQTGVRYQFYHAFAIMIAYLLSNHLPTKLSKWAAICFTIGILLFSGSLYGLACHHLLGTEIKAILGPLTPIGGVFFIVGWILLFFGSFSKASTLPETN